MAAGLHKVTRQSILVVTRNFPPLIGGMERLMQHSVEILASRFELTLIGPRGCGNSVPENVTVIECPATPFLFLLMSVLKGRRAVGISSFDIVLGGSGLVAPVTSFLSKVAKARSAIFVHGLDLVVDNLAYQKLFLPFLRRHDLVIANSQNTRKIAMAKGCAASKIQVLNPGAVIPPDNLLRDAASLRTKFGLENNGVVLFVGRMIRRKGLAEFLEHAWPRIIASEPNARLLVVGDSPDDALRRDVRAAQKLVSLVNNYSDDTIRFMGSVSDEALWEYYALAHVLVFPLIHVKGDVEGFGMVAIEAAACGTPTVAFSQGGVTDAVADGRSGVLVAENDYQAFADAVVDVCNSGRPTPAECRTHASGFSWSVFREKLLGMLAGEL